MKIVKRFLSYILYIFTHKCCKTRNKLSIEFNARCKNSIIISLGNTYVNTKITLTNINLYINEYRSFASFYHHSNKNRKKNLNEYKSNWQEFLCSYIRESYSLLKLIQIKTKPPNRYITSRHFSFSLFLLLLMSFSMLQICSFVTLVHDCNNSRSIKTHKNNSLRNLSQTVLAVFIYLMHRWDEFVNPSSNPANRMRKHSQWFIRSLIFACPSSRNYSWFF